MDCGYPTNPRISLHQPKGDFWRTKGEKMAEKLGNNPKMTSDRFALAARQQAGAYTAHLANAA
jgi:hypothetical protein